MPIPQPAPHPLTTPELLELTLSFLPPRSLLLAQRTCKTWHTLTTTSPTLQYALYFRASPSPPRSTPPPSNLNPLLTSAFPFFFAPRELGRARYAADWDLQWGDVDVPATVEPSVMPFVYSSFNRHPASFRREEASWRRMLVCDPPVQRVVWRRGEAGSSGHSVVESVTGFGGWAGERGESYVKLGLVGEDGGAGEESVGASLDLDLDLELGLAGERREGGIPLREGYLDLEKEEGLRMGVLYDYLFGNVCAGDIPGRWDVEFAIGHYPSPDEVVEHARRDSNLSLGALMRNEEGERHGRTMLVEVMYIAGCVVVEREEYPQFMSEGYRAVDVGPMVTVL